VESVDSRGVGQAGTDYGRHPSEPPMADQLRRVAGVRLRNSNSGGQRRPAGSAGGHSRRAVRRCDAWVRIVAAGRERAVRKA
jgi:hypothetical protein